MTVYEPPDDRRGITVRALLEDPELALAVDVVAGHSGVDREITHPRIQKSGLALVGHMHGIVPTRVQVLGETEISYVEGLPPDGQVQAARGLFSLGLSCVVVTRGAPPPTALVHEAEQTDTPLLLCGERSSSAITALHTLLDERLAPRSRVHGVLVDVFEVGVLVLGSSGIGKSECALELVMNGHRLVADDVVECDYKPPGMVFGEPAELLRHHIEVRGLGILNIKDLYGVTAIRARKRIDLVVQLELKEGDGHYDRIGLDERHRTILGVPIREVVLPVRPGRNMSAIIEIAARHELLRQAGHHPARDFVAQIERATGTGMQRAEPPRQSLPRAAPPESSAPPPVAPRRPK